MTLTSCRQAGAVTATIMWLICMCAGVKQNYARRHRIPIDAITFDYTCMPANMHPEAAPAEGGAYVNGMFVEGARWDHDTAQLAESQPKVGRVTVAEGGAYVNGMFVEGARWDHDTTQLAES